MRQLQQVRPWLVVHASMLVSPSVAPNVPAGQSVSAGEPWSQYLPVVHMMGTTVADGQ